ncbi:MAG: hypothetical protein NTY12_00760 [Candidatus Falkowbacteria bacterium]|nr:hypothetical protein [Candidatus Falkowbacteria bacterium]
MIRLKLSWINFYRSYFNLIVKPEQMYFENLRGKQIFIPKGLTLLQAARALKEKTESYEVSPHMDEEISKNLRSADEDYTQLIAIKVKGRSKNNLVFLSKEITLLEGLIFQLRHFFTEGKFFSKRIICAGTEGFGGTNPVIVIVKKKLTVEFIK